MCYTFLTKFEDDDEKDYFEDDTAQNIVTNFYIVAEDDNDEGLVLFESKYYKIFWTISPKRILYIQNSKCMHITSVFKTGLKIA